MAELASLFRLPRPLVNDKTLTGWLEKLQQHTKEDQKEQILQQLQGKRLEQWRKLLIGSEFSARYLCQNPEWLLHLLTGSTLEQPLTAEDYQALFALPQDMPLAEWDRRIRQLRNQAMTRIIWRDFNRLTDTMGTTQELTYLAEAAVSAALHYHYQALTQTLGTPTNKRGEAQPMLVIGMGKLGGWELNLSSDIDLIFAYPSGGETQGGKKNVANQEFFTRLGQALIKSLDAPTPDGFVFRVDMRLRPYGQSGALISSFDALEDYYQTQGREWERFAMIKARVIASNGKPAHTKKLMSILRSFTYRGYVDFSAINALRDLKQRINREVARRKLSNNVKLGQGGIREIEFIAQAFQIIRGGRENELQDRRLLPILAHLQRLNCLPDGVADQLAQAYCFLRDVEHGIQGFQDQQSQQLPEDDRGRARLAYVMDLPDWLALDQQLQRYQSFVHQQFNDVIADPEHDDGDAAQTRLQDFRALWLQAQEAPETLPELLEELGFDHPQRAQSFLEDLLRASSVVAMHSMGRARLDQLMPHLLERLAATDTPTETLARLIKLIIAVARRSAYLLLLIENPGALKQLVTLSQASPWIADRLAEHPALLDELLDNYTLYSIPDKADLAQELRQHVLRLEPDDLEAQMEALRYFRSAHALRVAACEVTGKLPLMKVSDYLTELAEVILEYALDLSWQQMVARHGYPDNKVTTQANFIILAYGKLGGIELGHGSDLDLVFVHGADTLGQTGGDAEGQRSIDNTTFYMRLGQKIIHFLNTQTPSGKVYEVDMRLRPSGNSGLLVTSFNAYQKYQLEDAWTWEHQALVRARPVAGEPALMSRFEQLRQGVLTRKRDPAQLIHEVVDMRRKMREQLGSKTRDQAAGRFDLKQDAGGIVDIEFMVQYAVLAWSHISPALTRYTDNIRILESLGNSGHLSAQEVQALIEAYKAFRSIGHRLALQQQPAVVDGNDWEAERQIVTRIWQQLLGANPEPTAN